MPNIEAEALISPNKMEVSQAPFPTVVDPVAMRAWVRG